MQFRNDRRFYFSAISRIEESPLHFLFFCKLILMIGTTILEQKRIKEWRHVNAAPRAALDPDCLNDIQVLGGTGRETVAQSSPEPAIPSVLVFVPGGVSIRVACADAPGITFL